jgi:hypothetical protein
MVDVTSICNQALAAIGTRTSISSIAEESNEARQCLLQYEPTKRHLLRAAHWGFARAYTNPALIKARYGTPENPLSPPADYTWSPSSLEPPPPWVYAYSLASPHILAVRYILPGSVTGVISPPLFGTQGPGWPEAWMGPMVKFETATITHDGAPEYCMLTNMPRALICYTTDVDDPNQFDESFLRAFVQAFAANMSYTLTGDIKLFDALLKTTNNLIIEARTKSANEGLATIDVMPDWFRVRGVGPAAGTGPWVAEYGPLFGGVL